MSDEDALTVTGGESKTLTPNTEYEGTITDLDTRESEFGLYLDIEIQPNGLDLTDTPSYRIPETVTRSHDLGKLIERFIGEPVEPGEDYDLAELFSIGTKVQFVTDEENEDGYVNIDKESVSHVSQELPDFEDYEADLEESESEVAYEFSDPLTEMLADIDYPADQTQIIGTLAQENGELVQEFKDAVESGAIEVVDGDVTHSPV